MNAEEMFRKSGAILEGHFLLTSGRHSPVYWEKFRVMQYPQYVQQLCGMIADHYRKESIDLVAGPTTAGIILAFEVAPGTVGSRDLGGAGLPQHRVAGRVVDRRLRGAQGADRDPDVP